MMRAELAGSSGHRWGWPVAPGGEGTSQRKQGAPPPAGEDSSQLPCGTILKEGEGLQRPQETLQLRADLV